MKSTDPVPELVQRLLDRHTRLWWSCGNEFPHLPREFSPAEQSANEKKLENLVDGLAYEIKHIPADEENRSRQVGRLKAQGKQFASRMLNLEPHHLEFIESSGLLEAAGEFVRLARKFDPDLSAADIYQAGRNVMTMNLLQLLLNLPVAATPAVFAYSLLYPYSDNFLDDPAVSPVDRLAFNQRFWRRLNGEAVQPASAQEAIICDLVSMIEGQWERSRYPEVYQSLLAIFTAQEKSLRLASPGASPYELDVLGISFEKGGASVLADGYLVAGSLTEGQAALMFGYGAFTQLMDDLEDVQDDLAKGQMTLFSQTAHRWRLDQLTNHVFHFGKAVFSDLGAFDSRAAEPVKELVDRAVPPLLIDSIGLAGRFYSKEYLRQVEAHFPFRFAALRRQRENLKRKKVTLERLVDSFVFRA